MLEDPSLCSLGTQLIVARDSIDNAVSVLTGTSDLSLGILGILSLLFFELTGAPNRPRYSLSRSEAGLRC